MVISGKVELLYIEAACELAGTNQKQILNTIPESGDEKKSFINKLRGYTMAQLFDKIQEKKGGGI